MTKEQINMIATAAAKTMDIDTFAKFSSAIGKTYGAETQIAFNDCAMQIR